ncbi:iron-sulfur cluster assembly accessory protein [Aquibacillus rhizosphaerae]|uniref:Uncharacterized protein n=1 Tax=Aquibacillus rhizosphaerae TaxID=3051431 RepID=A0ABT7L7N2_9BACI|nr:hypothetical protein [Aquibacillus sp. LR5S19]MDL4841220.1 hypothetical protein [Aquibacillus sp. LR5S19]
MALDEPQADDEVQEINGIVVAIDPIIKDQTNSLILDCQEQDGEKGLVLQGIEDCC